MWLPCQHLIWVIMLLLSDVFAVVNASDNPATLQLMSGTVTTGKLLPKNKKRETTTSLPPAHPHQGKVTPFQPGDPHIQLDEKALEVLDRGQPYQTQIVSPGSGSGGRGMVVQDVNAPAHVVWGRILDYDNYAKMVPKTIESENYQIVEHDDDDKNEAESAATNPPPAKTIFTRMKIGFPLLTLQFFVKHSYYPDLNSLTWTLDYSRKSDLDDSCGYWYVVPLSPTRTRVFYAVELSIFDWVPSFVVHFLKHKALTDATAWVKKYSEQEYEKVRAKEEEEEAAAEEEEEATADADDVTSIADADDAADSETPATKDTGRSGWRGWFGLSNSPRTPPEPTTTEDGDDNDYALVGDGNEASVDDETCASDASTSVSDEAEEVDDDEEDVTEETTAATKSSDELAVKQPRPSPVGLTRYALVASVFALSLYNVHLYFSS